MYTKAFAPVLEEMDVSIQHLKGKCENKNRAKQWQSRKQGQQPIQAMLVIIQQIAATADFLLKTPMV